MPHCLIHGEKLIADCMLCAEATALHQEHVRAMNFNFRMRREEEERERQFFSLPKREGYMVVPSRHMYGFDPGMLATSDYGCGTCDGADCEDCEPIYVREP